MAATLRELRRFLIESLGEGWIPPVAILGAAVLLGLLLHTFVLRGLLVLVGRTRTDLDEDVLRAVRGPLLQTVVLLGVFLAGLHAADDQAALGIGRGVLSLALVIWTILLLRLAGILLRYASQRQDRFPLIETRTYPLFANLTTVLTLIGATYLFLVVWDIDATGWLASAGIVGVALGFAAKDTLANLFAGVFIVADAPYQLGDYIVLDDGVRGEVTHIGLRSTRVLTRDDVEITIPNSVIASSKIVNQSGGGDSAMRVRVRVGVGYDSDVEVVRKILTEVAAAEPHAREDPAPRIRFRRFGESALEFELLVWVRDPTLRGRTVDALLTAILTRFRSEGIEIPFPKRDLIVRREEP